MNFKSLFEKNTLKANELLKKYNLSDEFLHINSKFVARGASIGIFVGMFPLPMHMLIITLFAFTPIKKFNLPIALLSCWIANPFTMPFIYYTEYLTGNFLLGNQTIIDVSLSLSWFDENIEKIAFPLFLGALFYAVIVSIISYASILKICNKKQCNNQ